MRCSNRPSRAAAVLSLALVSCCCQQSQAISSHSPLDLLAYPAYSVRLSSDPITNSTATRILRDARRSGGDAGIIEGQTPLSSALQQHHAGSHAHGGGPAAGAGAAAASFKPYLMRSAGQGQGYLCNVPAAAEPSAAADAHQQPRRNEQEQPMSPEQQEAQRRKVEEEKRLAYERGLALLDPLKGTCLYLTIGWFTYAFCHGSEIRQFHAIKVQNQNGLGIAEDPTQDSYTLGAWSNRVMEDEGLMDAKKARALGSLREILASEDKAGEDSSSHNAVGFVHGTGRGAFESGNGDEKRYLVQRWAGGTLCDKTGVERKVEVQFHCNSQSTDRIFFIRETAICEYVVVIHTPRLCGEQIFVGSAGGEDTAAHERRRKAVSVIECRPVVPDELLRLSQSNQAASARAQLDAAASASEQVVAQKANRHKAGLSQQGKPQPAVPATELNSQAQDVSGKQATGPSFDPLPPQPASRDTADSNQQLGQPSLETMGDGDMEEAIDFILTIDPETGEVRVEAEDGSDSRPVLAADQAAAGEGQPQQGWGADGGTAPELLGGQALDSLLDRLQASIARTLDTLGQAHAEGAPAADAQDRGREPATPPPVNEREPVGAGDGAAKGVAKQGKTDQQLSRLTRSGRGAQHHKNVAKQYIENQLKKQRGGAAAGRVAGGAGHPVGSPAQQQQLGSAQHRLLKQAFAAGAPWQEAEEDKERKDAPAQPEQRGQVQAPMPARARRDEL